MKLIQNLKELFSRNRLIETENFDLNNYEITFSTWNSKVKSEIKIYIEKNIINSEKIDDKKNNLKETNSNKYKSTSGLLRKLEEIVNEDISETKNDYGNEDWISTFFIDLNVFNSETITIYNALTTENDEMGNVIYSVASIRRYRDFFYIWSNND